MISQLAQAIDKGIIAFCNSLGLGGPTIAYALMTILDTI
jgi:hypothetical protein